MYNFDIFEILALLGFVMICIAYFTALLAHYRMAVELKELRQEVERLKCLTKELQQNG